MTDAKNFQRDIETDTLARTIWGEARGEGEPGMRAVAAVVMNRLKISREKGRYWWGNSIIQICQKPFQFSCWNKNDVNYRRILGVDVSDPVFAQAQNIARLTIEGHLPDPTDGATHYHAAGATPHWAETEKPVASIGHHIFYKMTDI